MGENSFLTLNMVVLALAALVMAGGTFTINGFRNDIKSLFAKFEQHGERLSAIESACDINHSGAYDEVGRRHARRKSDTK